ncbi:MAG: restriction endonuclease subunit S [Prevotella sp.]|nr:restriction endonuclease subunit S [Prevotella sp.]
MNAQQLKNTILQEAIEGRLVPQDPNDEPASVLLARIRQEKERLVKEGKLKKKDLEVKPISEDEIPFEIPDSWEWVRLKDIINGTGAGKSPNCEKRPKSGNEWGVITTTAIQYCSFLPNENKVLPSKFVVNELQIVKDKDLLITRAGPKNRTGIVCVVDKPCDKLILSDKTVRIDYFRGYCNPFFLMYALNNPTIHDSIMSATVGMAESQVNISQSSIQNIVIPLPPLAEQHRIVTKIEVFLPKVEEYGKAQDALNKLNAELPDRLKKSILQEAIEGRLVPQDPNDEPASILLAKIRKEKDQLVKEGKLKKKGLIEIPISEDEIPFEIPDSWEWVRLGSVCDYIHRGKSPKYGEKKKLPILAQKCNQWEHIYTDRCLFAQEETIDRYTEEQFLRKGDIVINSTGGGTVGRTGYVDDYVFKEYKRFVVDSHVTIVRGNKEVLGKYIYYFLISPLIQFGLEDRCSGSTNQIELGTTTICNYLFPLPPIAEQYRIVKKLEQLFGEIDKLKK